MPPVTVMIKPASGLCNMRCRYCFYADEAAKRETASYGLMSPETLEAVLRRVLSFAEGECTLAFQGGEPTLAGLPFFQRVVELGESLNVHRVRLHYAIQTNGYVLDDDWCAFFARNHFLVGLSLDGPKDLHDRNRLDAQGRGTFQRVMRSAALLAKHGADFNILTVVTSETARHIRSVYQFFARSGFGYQQYIPCLDPLGEVRGGHDYSLSPERFGQYLKDLFDCWYRDMAVGRPCYTRYFDHLVGMLMGQRPEACGMAGVCGRQYVVEADGGVYPCDFYMLDAYRLGSFVTDSFEQIEARREEIGFLQASAVVHEDCRRCKWGPLCRGGCRRDRDYGGDVLGKNYYCAAYQAFFDYAYPRLAALARQMGGGR